jgi:hypothetical protein
MLKEDIKQIPEEEKIESQYDARKECDGCKWLQHERAKLAIEKNLTRNLTRDRDNLKKMLNEALMPKLDPIKKRGRKKRNVEPKPE